MNTFWSQIKICSQATAKFCMAHQIGIVFTLLDSWKKWKEGYFMICDNKKSKYFKTITLMS
jgi:hypothetical protein